MITIASRDQFKPIRIGENLVVNYKFSCAVQLLSKVKTNKKKIKHKKIVKTNLKAN